MHDWMARNLFGKWLRDKRARGAILNVLGWKDEYLSRILREEGLSIDIFGDRPTLYRVSLHRNGPICCNIVTTSMLIKAEHIGILPSS